MSDYDDDDDEEDVIQEDSEDYPDEDDYDYILKYSMTQMYTCQFEGCTGRSEFRHNSEEWFEEKGSDSPVKCFPCKSWCEQQYDEGPLNAECQFCGYEFQITPYQRVTYKRNTGDWDEYWEQNREFQICRKCKEFPGRKQKIVYRKALKDLREAELGMTGEEKEKKRILQELERKTATREDATQRLSKLLRKKGLSAAPKRFDVPDAASYYHSMPVYEEHNRNRLEHILDAKHEWSDRFGSTNPQDILPTARRLAVSTETHVFQLKNTGNGNVIKYDSRNGMVVIIAPEPESPTSFTLITTFPAKSEEYVLNGLIGGKMSCK